MEMLKTPLTVSLRRDYRLLGNREYFLTPFYSLLLPFILRKKACKSLIRKGILEKSTKGVRLPPKAGVRVVLNRYLCGCVGEMTRVCFHLCVNENHSCLERTPYPAPFLLFSKISLFIRYLYIFKGSIKGSTKGVEEYA